MHLVLKKKKSRLGEMFLEVISSREPMMISEEESGVVHSCLEGPWRIK